jgi:hypothetical protein
MLTTTHKDLFPPLVVEMVEILNELYNAPEEMSLPIILAAINFPAQALANVNPIQWPSSPLSLNLCVLADTGGQKSTVMNAVTKAIEQFQAARHEQYKKDYTQYKIEKKQYDDKLKELVNSSADLPKPKKTSKTATLKNSFSLGDKHADPVNELGIIEPKQPDLSDVQTIVPNEPETPVSNLIVVQKATLNGIIDVLSESPFAGLFNPDAAEFFSSHAFQDKERGTEMIASLAKLYSGETVARQTGIRETNVYLAKRRFNMLVMLQQQLAGFLLDSKYNDQGFIPRMLITQPPVTTQKRFDFSAASVRRKAELHDRMTPFHDRIHELLCDVYNKQEKAIRDAKRDDPDASVSNKQLILPRLEFHRDCMPILEDFGNKMQDRCEDPANAAHRGYLRRTYENMCRVAATLTVFDGLDVIPVKYAQCAVELIEWFTAQRYKLEIDGDVNESRLVQACKAVERWMRKCAVDTPEQPITKKRLAQFGPNAYLKADTTFRTQILQELVDTGVIDVSEVKGKTKPVVVFTLKHDDEE